MASPCSLGAPGGAVGRGTAVEAQRSQTPFPIVSLEFFHWRNTSGRTMALGSTKPVTEMSTRNISWGIGGVGGGVKAACV